MPEHITQSVLAEIVGIAADAIICMDEDQRITFFNSGAETIFGWRSAEMLGQRIEVLIPEKHRSRHEEQVHAFGRSEVKARRMGERREIAGLRRNGEVFPAEAAISQVRQGNVTVYAVALRDVSTRHRFERRQSFLAEAGEVLASTFEMDDTLDRIISLAIPRLADGCIVEARIEVGYRPEATGHVDQAAADALLLLRRVGTRNLPANHPLGKMADAPQAILIDRDASVRLVDVTTNREYKAALELLRAESALFIPMIARGELIAVLTLFRSDRGFDADDVTLAEDFSRLAALAMDNARLHETLRRNLRSRDEMIGIVSHDLRNPVAAVKMLSKAILDNSANQSMPGLESIALMSQAADQMDALIRDLLDVSRLDSGKMRLQLEAIDPAWLVDDSLRTLAPLAAAKNVSLRNSVSPGLPPVSADIERVQQVISNLVGNALKFTPPGGSIDIEATPGGNEIQFSVRDTGGGIAADQLPHVFDRYWQSSRTDKHGAGLGLAIARGIVEAHGGRISLESKLGQGTVASFTLPHAQA